MQKTTKTDVKLDKHYICNDCTRDNATITIFYNGDDNVCAYCGSKMCSALFQAELQAEVDYLILNV